MSVSEILAALLDATPRPQPGLSPDEVLEAFTRMHERRSEILLNLGATPMLAPGEAAMAAELEARDAAWMLCLAAAKQATADQRLAASRMRAYSP